MDSGTSRIETKAHAKVNLDLRVLGRRPDGYHELDTLFARIELHDTVAVRAVESGIRLDVDGDVGGAATTDNLVYRAAELMLRAVGGPAGVDGPPGLWLELGKRIPTGAGLGGGSSDAAAALRLINRLWGNPLTRSELVSLGATIGADVAFFVSDDAAAWGTGRGDILTPATLPSGGAVLLALPNVHVSTVEAYARLAESGTVPAEVRPRPLNDRPSGDWPGFALDCQNDFEPAIHRWHPDLGTLHRALAADGALVARMSGSGAAHFAVWPTAAEAEREMSRLAADWSGVRFLVTAFA